MRWLIGLSCVAGLVLGTAATASAATTRHPTTGPTDLPKSCTVTPQLAAVSPTPTFPTNYQILDAVPGALATQYPTVYGGILVAPPTPGESDLDINSHFVVLERVHDPALESEARTAYPAPLTVAFQLTPRSAVCLNDISSQITAQESFLKKVGIHYVGGGGAGGSTTANVSVTNCTPRSERLARRWFATHFGSAVVVAVCQKIPTFPLGQIGH